MNDRPERDDRPDRSERDEPIDGEIDLRTTHPGEQLSALVDGELDPHEAAAVRTHLDGCEACRDELDDVAAVRGALRGLPAVPAPPGFVGELVDRRHRANRRAVGVTLAAAVLAVVLGVVVAGRTVGSTGAGGPESTEQAGAAPSTRVPGATDEAGGPGGSVGTSEDPGTTPGPGARLQRWDAGRPDPDVKLSIPVDRRPSDGDDDSALDRAHDVGRDLLDALGG